MPTNFLGLPGELRNKIYTHLLVREEPITPWYHDNELAPNLLRANKTIHHEAKSLLYGRNCFDLTGGSFQLISQFLNQIGCHSATHIQCICIDFSIICDVENRVRSEEGHFRLEERDFRFEEVNFRFEDESSSILANIQNACTHLTTLITSPRSTYTLELNLEFNSPKIVAKALALLDARFRAITSLQEIIVEAFDEGPSDDIRREMASYGWTVKIVEVEPAEESVSDRFPDYFDDDDDDDDYDDDYEIDNDSDFWRRAAD
ncbi:hypothetical protein BDW59DRAFT_175374 [Aspergillus cavernicola]|uniref:F-box domain-containing protein n=1 Tax=Aspergillus cavernicola TaxID=176166 RepID=A0ABR4HQI5_9EURO